LKEPHKIVVNVRIGERRVTPKIPPKITIAISSDDGVEHGLPIRGAVYVPFTEQGAREIAEIIEAEKGMIAGASKMPVVGRTLLPTVGFAD